jgi:hypothetical protein
MSKLVSVQIFEGDVQQHQNTVQIYDNSFAEYIVHGTESCAMYKCNVERQTPLWHHQHFQAL